MNREQAKEEIKRAVKCEDYLTPSKGGMFCCPFCGSGNGPNHSGAVKVYEDGKFYCHACHKSGDVIDLVMNDSGVDYNEALSILSGIAGVEIDSYTPDSSQIRPEQTKRGEHEQDIGEMKKDAPADSQEVVDYTEYYKKCRDRIWDPDALAYLTKRGISRPTASAYWVGYDPAWKSPKALRAGHKPPATPRLIIPTSRTHYIARDIRPDASGQYAKMNEGRPGLFNSAALYAEGLQALFVVEGAIDALSIIEAGSPALALNSTGNISLLLDMLKQKRTMSTLILCLDNDDAGRKATQKLREGLHRLNVSFIVWDITNGCKDPNDALVSDRDSFQEAIEQAVRQTSARPDNTMYYLDSLMTSDIEAFKSDVKTGFYDLDLMTGGLYAGLYCLAAISSLGKTSFALQLADQIAASGHDVLFFSLEQSRLELVSKSLARLTARENLAEGVTSLSIRKGYLPEKVLTAEKLYKKEIGDRLSIIEGNFSCDISFIGDYIRRYMSRNEGIRPVVFIDYLQILQPDTDQKQTTREIVDNTITELKRMSRDLNLTIIAISSVNRMNYLAPIDFESLKESGSIEYSCDVVWGLQLQCIHEEIFDKKDGLKKKRERVKQAKAEDPRKIELSCIKNRYGRASFSCCFDYYPANDLFNCSDAPADDFSVPAGQNAKKPRRA